MSVETWSVLRLLKWTTDYLRGKGVESASLEARILLAHVLGWKPIELYTRGEDEPPEDVRATFKELIKRRVAGCPVAYLIGKREFYKLEFEVAPAVLIPRPETEYLVMECLRLIKPMPHPRILDIGTGTGCIALSIVHQHSTAEATATDISADALAIAERNAARHGLSDRVHFLQGDLFEAVPRGAKFDVIVSNPPYIAENEMQALPIEIREHEPVLALHGGVDGLNFYRRLLAAAWEYLAPAGHLVLEIGSTQEPAIRSIFEHSGRFTAVNCLKDANKLPRVITAILG